MKKTRRYALITLTLCLGLVLGVSAFASLPTVDPERTGSIIIQSLAVEDVGSGGSQGTGETAEPEGEPLANISYTVTRVEDDSQDPLTAKALEGDGEYSKTQSTDESGEAKFEELAQGVYLVRQEDSAAVTVSTAPFLVSVPMTNPAGTGWNYTVYVYPKYQVLGVPGIEAYITQTGNKYDSAGQLDTVLWIAAAELPADIGEAQDFRLQAVLHQYLDYQSAAVYLQRESGRTTLEPEEDYTLSQEENTVEIDLTGKGLEKLGVAAGGDKAALHTELTTQLNIPTERIEESLGAPLELAVSLYYKSSVGLPYTSTPEEAAPYVYTGGFNILQVQGSGTQPLAGTTFKVYRSEEDARAGTNAVTQPGGTGDWEATAGEFGEAAYFGLPYGGVGTPADEAEATYYLVQTSVPQGFNLLRAPVQVSVDSASHVEENRVLVRSKTGFLLPATGGMGTVWFTIIGLLLIGAAVAIFLRARGKGRGGR